MVWQQNHPDSRFPCFPVSTLHYDFLSDTAILSARYCRTMTALLLYATINRKIISLVRAQKFPHVGTKTGQTIKCKLFANYGFIRLSGFLYTFAAEN